YDSLDTSLGQARNNLYIAVKCWASYLGLARLFQILEAPAAGQAALEAAIRIQQTVRALAAERQPLPAVFEKQDAGYSSRILPAIEPLVYPLAWNSDSDALAPFMELYGDLKSHTAHLLSDAERGNHFPDGGIRLSSTSDNSWASKIAIVEHVARELFNL